MIRTPEKWLSWWCHYEVYATLYNVMCWYYGTHTEVRESLTVLDHHSNVSVVSQCQNLFPPATFFSSGGEDVVGGFFLTKTWCSLETNYVSVGVTDSHRDNMTTSYCHCLTWSLGTAGGSHAGVFCRAFTQNLVSSRRNMFNAARNNDFGLFFNN